jgi:hypothetical protein
MRTITIDYKFVEFIPEELEEGTLYISKKYQTAVHKCCCGCGEEVVTPLTPTDWHLEIKGNKVSLNPSIGNWSYACRSHYFLHNSEVVWAGDMSTEAIQKGRDIDKSRKEKYFDHINSQKDLINDKPSQSILMRWITNTVKKVRSWLSL